MRDTRPTPKLSISAAQAIYLQIANFDDAIDQAAREQDSALAMIANTQDRIVKAFTERVELSKQLDQFAPEDFVPGAKVNIFAKTPGPFAARKPWHRKMPHSVAERIVASRRDAADAAEIDEEC